MENVHISNLLNTSHTSADCRTWKLLWRMTISEVLTQCIRPMLVSWTKFPFVSKRKPISTLLISKTSDTFLYKPSECTSNSWPVFFWVFFSASITKHATLLCCIIRRNCFGIWQMVKVIENGLLHLDYGCFYYKNVWIRYSRPLFTQQSSVRHLLFWMHALHLTGFATIHHNDRA